MANHSLRKKLLLWLLLPLLCLIAIDSSILYRIAMHFQRKAFDHALNDTAYDISQLINESKDSGKRFQLRPEVRKMILSDQYDQMYYSIIDTSGNVIGGDQELKPMPALHQNKSPAYFTFGKIGQNLIRVAVISSNVKTEAGSQNVYIQVAETLNKRNRLAEQILIGIIVPQVILLLTAAALLWFGIGRGLMPLWDLHAAVSRRSHRDLSPVQMTDIPDEVRALVDSVNFLMKQLQHALESQNRFIADAAHQLRTPLAGMLAQVELAQHEADPVELQACLTRVASSMERLAHLVNQLLRLAHSQPEAIHNIQFCATDLSRLAQQTTMEMVPAAYQKDIDLGFEGLAGKVMIEGEPQRLKELLFNLIDNAIRYTQHGGKVTVSVTSPDNRARLSVEDNGLGIPPEERDKVFERFHRVIGTQQEGSGLGLAIVMEIAQIHHAEVTLDVPESGIGTRVSVLFDLLDLNAEVLARDFV